MLLRSTLSVCAHNFSTSTLISTSSVYGDGPPMRVEGLDARSLSASCASRSLSRPDTPLLPRQWCPSPEISDLLLVLRLPHRGTHPCGRSGIGIVSSCDGGAGGGAPGQRNSLGRCIVGRRRSGGAAPAAEQPQIELGIVDIVVAQVGRLDGPCREKRKTVGVVAFGRRNFPAVEVAAGDARRSFFVAGNPLDDQVSLQPSRRSMEEAVDSMGLK